MLQFLLFLNSFLSITESSFLHPLLLRVLSISTFHLSSKNPWDITLSEKTEVTHSFFIGVILLIVLLSFLIVILILFFRSRISNLKQQEEVRLQKIKSAIAEKERAQIAADLHDGLCSDLSALLNFLSILKQRPEPQKQDYILNDIELCIHNALDSTRIISHNLMPSKFDHNGLIEVLENFARLTSSSAQVKFKIIVPDQHIRLPKNVTYELFRIIQELTQNMIKHGKVTAIQLFFKIQRGQLLIQIFNNGIPFDVAKKKIPTDGIGLRCIKMRLKKIAATLQNKFSPNGNLIELKIPLTA